MKKIQVLLIDDYPSFALTRIGDIPGLRIKGLQPHQLDRVIPHIGRAQIVKQTVADEDIITPDSVTTEVQEIAFDDFFELKWLKNADEIMKFRKTCQAIEDNHNPDRLGETDGYVPEIVLFDYALTGHESKTYADPIEDKAIIQHITPYHLLLAILSEDERQMIEANSENLQIASRELEAGINSDNLGCIGGVMTVNYFRKHPCVGIATSRKSDEHLNGQEAKFIEALVREPDQFEFGLRGNLRNLEWPTLLPHAALMLQRRIKQLLKSGQLQISLEQLLDLSDGNFPDRNLITLSTYGRREWPLDGLFININQEERDQKISGFADECLAIILNSADSILTKDILSEALAFCEDLLNQYDNEKLFLERIRYSQLMLKHENGNLTDSDWEELIGIRIKYNMPDDAESYANCYDLRSYDGANDKLVKRYAALFVMVHVYYRYWYFKDKKSYREEFSDQPFLRTAPEKMDYLMAIYPRPATPVVLPLHRNTSGLDNDLKRNTERLGADGLMIAKILKKENGITRSEKFLLQSFAISLGLTTENFADWFK
jgi:hypothetical protein